MTKTLKGFKNKGEVTVTLGTSKKETTFYFYEYNKKFFRCDLLLEEKKDIIEIMESRTKLHKSHQENLDDFMGIIKEKKATVVETKLI